VIGYLQSLIAKSQKATATIHTVLGHFSIIGLLRVYSLLGDYYLALKVITPLDIGAHKGIYTTVTASYITLYYYLGFVYLMIRRYVDATRTFSHILLFINRTKQNYARSYQFDQVIKKSEQMYGLLAICLSLCPQRVDETVHTTLREKYSDKMVRMQKGDEACFEELFSYACPKFINPAPPNFALTLEDPIKYPPMNYNQEAMRLQTKLFLNEVKQQSMVPTVRSFLKLYTTIPVQKLSAFVDLDEKTFRKQLLCFKHKTRGTVWTGGSPLSGEMISSYDVDFYLDKDMIHISDTKVQKGYADFFIRHINKFTEIMAEVDKSSHPHT
jgi:translation initiation factor 3 subunit L